MQAEVEEMPDDLAHDHHEAAASIWVSKSHLNAAHAHYPSDGHRNFATLARDRQQRPQKNQVAAVMGLVLPSNRA